MFWWRSHVLVEVTCFGASVKCSGEWYYFANNVCIIKTLCS